MNKFIATLAAASMLLASQGNAFASDFGKSVRPIGKPTTVSASKNDLGKFAIGVVIGAGLVGAALAAERQRSTGFSDRHDGHDGHRFVGYGGERNICRIWRSDCRHGDDRACFKFDQRC